METVNFIVQVLLTEIADINRYQKIEQNQSKFNSIARLQEVERKWKRTEGKRFNLYRIKQVEANVNTSLVCLQNRWKLENKDGERWQDTDKHEGKAKTDELSKWHIEVYVSSASRRVLSI